MDVGHFLGIVAYLLPVSVYWKTMGWRERGEWGGGAGPESIRRKGNMWLYINCFCFVFLESPGLRSQKRLARLYF